MSETDDLLEETALSEFLLHEVKAYYDSDGQGILLANLGWAVLNTKPHLKHLLQRYKLGRFIKTKLAGKVEVKGSPEKPTEVRVFPIQQPSVVPSAAEGLSGVIVQPTPREYSRAALTAFTRPIQQGHTRILNLEVPLYFEDIPGLNVDLQPNQVLIKEQDIFGNVPPLVTEAGKAAFDDCVDTWIAKANIGLELLLQQKRRSSVSKAQSSQSLLDALLDSLSPTELKRVQLPLDVIVKLKAIQR